MRSIALVVCGLAIGVGASVAAANIPDGYVDLLDMNLEEIITHCADAIEYKNQRGRIILGTD